MHFLECYALNCGLKIDKPFIKEEECNLPAGDYVTFHVAKDFQSKSYHHWQEVIDVFNATYPNLDIVQIGPIENNPKYESVLDYTGKTNFNQSAFLMKRAKLHVGIDSFPAHLASCFEIPSFLLYSHTYKEQCYPFFTKIKHLRLIQAPLNTPKPSYSSSETNPCINNIRPLEINSAIDELLSST